MSNVLYYGDNLTVLRQHIKAESVDLIYLDPPFKSDQDYYVLFAEQNGTRIYLDPPFKSDQDYNVLFAEQNGTRSSAQNQAFKDTWRWDQAAAAAYQQVLECGGCVALAMQGMRQLLGCNDKGIDGWLFFHDDADAQQTRQVVISVKSGIVSVSQVRDLLGVVQRENAALAVLICLEKPTRAMQAEAAQAGYYQSPWGTRHPRLQLLTIEQLLAGQRIDLPPTGDQRTFKKAPQARRQPRGPMSSSLLF